MAIGRFSFKIALHDMKGSVMFMVSQETYDVKEAAATALMSVMHAHPGIVSGWVVINAVTPEKIGPYAGPNGEELAVMYYVRRGEEVSRSFMFVHPAVNQIAEDAARENLGIIDTPPSPFASQFQ
jgi:hypothetical protein